jgi:Uma2 family endonuclease
MATSARMSMTEYLHSTFEPDAEYVNGEIQERNIGEYDHNAVQKAILLWFEQHDKEWRTRSMQEQRTRLRSGNVRLPDVSMFPRNLPIEQVYTRPQLIVIEVPSPEERQSKYRRRSPTTSISTLPISCSLIQRSEPDGIAPVVIGSVSTALKFRHPLPVA